MKSSIKLSSIFHKGQALKALIVKRKKPAACTVAVYGTSTIVGKVDIKS